LEQEDRREGEGRRRVKPPQGSCSEAQFNTGPAPNIQNPTFWYSARRSRPDASVSGVQARQSGEFVCVLFIAYTRKTPTLKVQVRAFRVVEKLARRQPWQARRRA
jgi:hypothetical protein